MRLERPLDVDLIDTVSRGGNMRLLGHKAVRTSALVVATAIAFGAPIVTAGAAFADTPANGSICGTVWKDLNGNGRRDAGEPGMADLLSINNGPGYTYVNSDDNGNYCFTGLASGTYQVQANDLVFSDLGFTLKWSADGDHHRDSRFDPATGQATVTLTQGEDGSVTQVKGFDAGYVDAHGDQAASKLVVNHGDPDIKVGQVFDVEAASKSLGNIYDQLFTTVQVPDGLRIVSATAGCDELVSDHRAFVSTCVRVHPHQGVGFTVQVVADKPLTDAAITNTASGIYKDKNPANNVLTRTITVSAATP
ncbi:hypothetical protein F0L68_03985 [Solihabitans fulvus]|uniref:SD-repeat containing protein B domain-containing protein n=1 Tax=Solihabitans fulvus TaxID=1892852 RepID=A0A5B2XP95_9PSEU|nr:SdrD B-like domain-containing protein [Solihabitans fulvus]KAA2265738.1 hypothetical protein F0L68_03985 [Solihabitans fulvus]